MPKIISNLENKIFDAAKSELKKKGYKNLSVRAIADKCSIALGTIYNYYPSKEILVAMIINEDWEKKLASVIKESSKAESLHQALLSFSKSLCEFTKKYSSIWLEYSYNGKSGYTAKEMHIKLINQLKSCMNEFYKRYNVEVDDISNEVFVEALLVIAVKDADYEKIGYIIERLLNI